jgi:hypothetical protein
LNGGRRRRRRGKEGDDRLKAVVGTKRVKNFFRDGDKKELWRGQLGSCQGVNTC